ncbi:MAG: ImmA/IrrE family metallo-endopeptidase [Leptotrichia hongkongensis]
MDKYNTKFIFLKKRLSSQEEIDILIHEFGHFILHKQYLLSRRSR